MPNNKELAIILKMKDQASKKLEGVSGKLKKFKAVAIGAAVAGVGVLSATLIKCTKDAADQEMVFAKLQQAVENVGISWSTAKGQIDEFTAAMQRTTVYGDTETAKLLQDLLPYTNDLGKAMEGAKIAMDMAAAGLFDINTASKYVGMAMQGNVEMLGRYVGELRTSSNEQLKNMSASPKTADALDILKQKYGGMAEKELNTFSGKMKQLNNYVSDLREGIGDGLIPVLTQLAGSLTASGENMAATGKRWGKSIGTAIRIIINSFNNVAYSFQTLGLCFSKGVVHAKRLFNMFYREIILDFARKTSALLTKLPWGWGKAFEGMADKAQAAYDRSKEKTKEFEKQIKILNDTIKRTGDDLSKKYIPTLKGVEKNTNEAAGATGNFGDKLADLKNDAGKAKGALDELGDKAKDTATQISTAINRAFIEQEAREAAKAQGLSGKIYRDEQGDIRMKGTPSPMSMSQRMSVFSAYGEAFWDVVIGKLPPMYAVATDINIARKAHAAWVAGKDMPAGVTLKFEGGAPPTSEMVRQDPEKWQDYIKFQVATWGEGYAKTLWGDLAKEIGAEIGLVLGKSKMETLVEQAKQQTTQNININLPNAIAADGKTLKSAAGIIGEEIGRQVSRGQLKGW